MVLLIDLGAIHRSIERDSKRLQDWFANFGGLAVREYARRRGAFFHHINMMIRQRLDERHRIHR